MGAESKQWLADFTSLVERAEKVMGKGKGTKAARDITEDVEDEEETTALAAEAEDDEDEDFAPKKSAKKAASSFDDEDEEEETTAASDDDETETTDEDEEEEKPKKAAKPKKTTLTEVNDACKARAARTTRAEVLGILKKQFKVKSVTDLDAKQYADVVKAMSARK